MKPVRTLLATLVGVLALGIFSSVSTGDAPATPDPSSTLHRFELDGNAIARRFPAAPSIAFRYPSNWYVTTRRLDNVLDPRTLFAVTTYPQRARPRDDCDGTHGRGRPDDGAFVLVKETLDATSIKLSLPRLEVRPRHLRLPTSGSVGCLAPPSVVHQFRVAGRAFYVWISVGPRASATTRAAVSALLDSLWIARYGTS